MRKTSPSPDGCGENRAIHCFRLRRWPAPAVVLGLIWRGFLSRRHPRESEEQALRLRTERLGGNGERHLPARAISANEERQRLASDCPVGRSPPEVLLIRFRHSRHARKCRGRKVTSGIPQPGEGADRGGRTGRESASQQVSESASRRVSEAASQQVSRSASRWNPTSPNIAEVWGIRVWWMVTARGDRGGTRLQLARHSSPVTRWISKRSQRRMRR